MQYQKQVHSEGRKGLPKVILVGLLAGLLVSGVIPGAMADTVKDLYVAQVLVADQSKDERTEALKQAFMQILIRVSGRSEIIEASEYPTIQGAIEQARRYAQQYRYLRYTPPAGADQTKKLSLWVRFDEAAVTKLLRSNNIAVWGSTRPATLVWLVIDNRGQRELIGNNTPGVARDTLLREAHFRGLPLRLPLLDLRDRSALRTSDVWGNFESTIMQASQRYQTEAVLVGRIFQSYGGHWNGRWSVYSDSRRKDWTVTGSTLAEVLNPGIDVTTETLAARYASIGTADASAVQVQIKDIKSLSDYNRALAYLEKLSSVSAVQTLEVSANDAIFNLITPSGRLGVARAVALGHTLINEPAPEVNIPDLPRPGEQAVAPPALSPDLVYRLVP